MAESKTLKTRVQHPVYTAAALTSKNPVLLKGEVVYESDTRKHKVGDGVTAWNALPYAAGGGTSEAISAASVQQDATHRFVTDAEKTAWSGKASTAVATQSANGLMPAADKAKFDDMWGPYEIVSPLSLTLSGVECEELAIKFVPGFEIIRAKLKFTRSAARVTTSAFSVTTSAVIDAYASYVAVASQVSVKIVAGGSSNSASFMFQVPTEALNSAVTLHCAIPITSFVRL